MLDDRPLPKDLEFAIQNKSPAALFARLWGYWPKPDFECLYYNLISRLFQGMVLRILYYLPFQGTFPSLSYFFRGGSSSFLEVADHTPSGNKLCKALGKIGYRVDHQTGSHIILRNEVPPYRRLTVPNHKEIAKGTLRAIIRQAGLTLEECNALL